VTVCSVLSVVCNMHGKRVMFGNEFDFTVPESDVPTGIRGLLILSVENKEQECYSVCMHIYLYFSLIGKFHV
jgi:hypothetical protein